MAPQTQNNIEAAAAVKTPEKAIEARGKQRHFLAVFFLSFVWGHLGLTVFIWARSERVF